MAQAQRKLGSPRYSVVNRRAGQGDALDLQRRATPGVGLVVADRAGPGDALVLRRLRTSGAPAFVLVHTAPGRSVATWHPPSFRHGAPASLGGCRALGAGVATVWDTVAPRLDMSPTPPHAGFKPLWL